MITITSISSALTTICIFLLYNTPTHTHTHTRTGQKAGYLGCAYFVGNFIGSLFWGWVSDIAGRRPALLIGMCGIIGSEIFFAFSQTFAWALAARFLWGALNGNIGIGKTYISDVSTIYEATVCS